MAICPGPSLLVPLIPALSLVPRETWPAAPSARVGSSKLRRWSRGTAGTTRAASSATGATILWTRYGLVVDVTRVNKKMFHASVEHGAVTHEQGLGMEGKGIKAILKVWQAEVLKEWGGGAGGQETALMPFCVVSRASS